MTPGPAGYVLCLGEEGVDFLFLTLVTELMMG